MARKIVLCDECNHIEFDQICEECGMWLCSSCAAKHVCEDDVDMTFEEFALAQWNQRVAEAWNLPQQRSGGDGA